MDEQEVVERTSAQPDAPGGTPNGPDGALVGPPGDGGSADGLSEDRVREALKNVYDPELGINIVDLGLVYEVEVQEGRVDITYSLTTMGCPIGPMIEDQMRSFVGRLEGVDDVVPEMVLRPAWSPEMMSDEAKAALGVF